MSNDLAVFLEYSYNEFLRMAIITTVCITIALQKPSHTSLRHTYKFIINPNIRSDINIPYRSA